MIEQNKIINCSPFSRRKNEPYHTDSFPDLHGALIEMGICLFVDYLLSRLVLLPDKAKINMYIPQDLKCVLSLALFLQSTQEKKN
jgi:hypothetical protein